MNSTNVLYNMRFVIARYLHTAHTVVLYFITRHWNSFKRTRL